MEKLEKLHQLKARAEYRENNALMTLSARYGFDTALAARTNQRPYFSITSVLYENDHEIGGGCQHELIALRLPNLAPIIRWHLCDDLGVPMHYTANAAYWAELAIGVSQWSKESASERKHALDVFKSHVVFGAFRGDALPECLQADALPYYESSFVQKAIRREIREEVAAWCEARRASLRRAFYRDMRAFKVIA